MGKSILDVWLLGDLDWWMQECCKNSSHYVKFMWYFVTTIFSNNNRTWKFQSCVTQLPVCKLSRECHTFHAWIVTVLWIVYWLWMSDACLTHCIHGVCIQIVISMLKYSWNNNNYFRISRNASRFYPKFTSLAHRPDRDNVRSDVKCTHCRGMMCAQVT